MNAVELIDLISIIDKEIDKDFHYGFDEDYNITIKDSKNCDRIIVQEIDEEIKSKFKKLAIYNTMVFIPFYATYSDVMRLMKIIKIKGIMEWKLPNIEELQEIYKLYCPYFNDGIGRNIFDSKYCFWTRSPYYGNMHKTIASKHSMELGVMFLSGHGAIIFISKKKLNFLSTNELKCDTI